MIEALIGLVGGLVIAAVSAVIGYRLGEHSTKKKEEREALEEELDAKLYADIVKNTRDGHVMAPNPESGDFRRVVRLQQRGLIQRLPRSLNFTVPDAPILLDTTRRKQPSDSATQE